MTSINYVEDAAGAMDALVAAASQFRLSSDRAQELLREVLDGTRNWREVARANGVKEQEIPRFAPALDRFR